MIEIKKQLEFTEEEKVLYKRYIKKAKTSKHVSFIKVPIMWVTETIKPYDYIAYHLVYSNGINICSEVFEVSNNKYDIVEFEDSGQSYAIIYRYKRIGMLFCSERAELFKLHFNPHSRWSEYN